MSCRLHGYPGPSLATFSYRSSPPAGLLDYIPYFHIAAVCMFELVVLLLLGYKWGSIYIYIYIYIMSFEVGLFDRTCKNPWSCSFCLLLFTDFS